MIIRNDATNLYRITFGADNRPLSTVHSPQQVQLNLKNYFISLLEEKDKYRKKIT